MTERGRIPEIPRDALRDVATEVRVEEVWARLEGDLRGHVRGRPGRRVPFSAMVATAAAALLFAFPSGVFVGARFWAAPAPAVMFASEPSGVGERAPTAVATASPSVEGNRAAERPRRGTGRVSRPHHPPVRPSGEPIGVAAPAPAPPAPTASPRPEWYELWDADEYQPAREAIERQGGFDAVLEKASADQAMAMADIARSTHENTLAIAALRRVIDRYPHDPNAPLAAFTLGNLLERAGDPKGAAAAFSAYQALSPDGDFAEDVLARQIEAAVEQGDGSRARELLAQYEKQYPAGSRLDTLRAAVATIVPLAEAGSESGRSEGIHAADPAATSARPEGAPSATPSASSP
ncbi:MAG: tetratricopeptide repeat protein [Polyangiaceae bacterium]|nr:tetratricopeptide repeat protein [Polyangiaceae bacterium]